MPASGTDFARPTKGLATETRRWPMLTAALDLARRGLRVFPLHSVVPYNEDTYVCRCGSLQCSNPAKHPMARLAPRGFLDASTDEHRIREWWISAPVANMA